VPATAALGVAKNTHIAATFSEAMNAATLTSASTTVTNTTPGSAVHGGVSHPAASHTVTFTPTAATLANASINCAPPAR
jgi:hypothetical protein